MSVTRCPTCGRGNAGYLDSEKTISNLTASETETEIMKYTAKQQRIREYADALRDGAVTSEQSPPSRACPGCGQGWREFQNHRKDLEQLDAAEARSAIAATTRDLNALIDRQRVLQRAVATTGGATPPDPYA